MDWTLRPRAWISLTWSWPFADVVEGTEEAEGVGEVSLLCWERARGTGGCFILKSGGLRESCVVGSVAATAAKLLAAPGVRGPSSRGVRVPDPLEGKGAFNR